MNTFLGLVGSALPTSGTRLSLLSMELPRAVTPTVAGLTVGGFVGVVGVIAVLLLVGRGSRRRTERPVRMPARIDQVVLIPPYGTLQRDTPLPPAAFQVPPSPAYAQVPGHAHLHSHLAPGPSLPFRPSTNLSARAFAKMGYGVEVQVDDERDSLPSRDLDGDLEDDDIKTKAWASSAPTLPVEESGPVSALKPAPHPLGIIPARSSAMQAAPHAASFADLDLDERATEIGGSSFDEPPQARRRSDPPKIRPVAPSGPRLPASAPLPPPTPPPARVRPLARD